VVVLALEQAHLLLHLRGVLLQQLTPLVGGVLALAGQRRVAAHLGDRHSGVAQAAEQHEPAQVVVGEDPPSARRTTHVGEQADLLVVPQGVQAEAAAPGGLRGRVTGGRVTGHGRHVSP